MYKIVLLLFSVTLFFSGCRKVENTPQQTAKLWMQALINGDHTAANEYSTTEVHFINAKALENFRENPQAKNKLQQEMNQIDSYKVVINGDTAQLFAPGEKNNPLLLKKVNGKWRVAYKESL